MQKIKQSDKFGLGQNILKMRKQKGLTQAEVSERLSGYGLNVSRVTYNKMEHNYYAIRIEELLALKETFECNYRGFF